MHALFLISFGVPGGTCKVSLLCPSGPTELNYSSKEEELNNAVALKEYLYLEKAMGK
jgi:hypothetical protein